MKTYTPFIRFIITYTISLVLISIGVLCLTGCDGSDYDVHIMTAELHGEWCTADLGTCLKVVNHELDDHAFYEWITPTCGEDGVMSGGLEFTPRLSRCPEFGWPEYPGLYSASARWTDRGISIHVDGMSSPLDLEYQP